MISFDEHIFEMGWSHQLVLICLRSIAQKAAMFCSPNHIISFWNYLVGPLLGPLWFSIIFSHTHVYFQLLLYNEAIPLGQEGWENSGEIPLHCYYWWKKSCTAWHVWNPVNKGIFTISTGVGKYTSPMDPVGYELIWWYARDVCPIHTGKSLNCSNFEIGVWDRWIDICVYIHVFATLNNHVLMDVLWNTNLSCNDLESFNWNTPF